MYKSTSSKPSLFNSSLSVKLKLLLGENFFLRFLTFQIRMNAIFVNSYLNSSTYFKHFIYSLILIDTKLLKIHDMKNPLQRLTSFISSFEVLHFLSRKCLYYRDPTEFYFLEYLFFIYFDINYFFVFFFNF